MTRARDVANIDGLLTTTGDTYYASAAATPVRLGIGSTGQVLSVSGGVPSWETPSSGSMTSIASGTFTGTALNITSIPTTYNKLILQMHSYDPAESGRYLQMRVNSDTANKYLSTTSTFSSSVNYNIGFLEQVMHISGQHNTDTRLGFYMEFYNYASTTAPKIAESLSVQVRPDFTADAHAARSYNAINTTAQITSLNLFESAGGSFTISYQLWGVK
jgi:hypothetical protein